MAITEQFFCFPLPSVQCTLCYIESSESCHIASADDDVTEDNNNDVDAETDCARDQITTQYLTDRNKDR